MADIMIVEDEASIRQVLGMHLRLVGHRVREAQDAGQARALFAEKTPDLALLDIMLPGEDGFSLGEFLIAKEVPVLFLTAKTAVPDRVRGISMGAQDYILKPFEMQELLARVSAVLRRVKKENNSISFDNINVDFDSRKVYVDGNETKLTPKEFDLLEVLIRNRNIALTRDRLLDLVWDMDFAGDTRTVDIHIQQLRKKLGLKERIRSMYKIGYRFEL